MSDVAFKEPYESIEAHESLKTLWFLRFIGDLLIVGFTVYFIFEKNLIENIGKAIAALSIVVYLISEMYFIVQFYKKNENSIYILHIYSFISLLNFPVGFGFSVIHYLKSRHLKWS